MTNSWDKFKLPRNEAHFDNLREVSEQFFKQPYIKYTQGGSSRKNCGAKVAAVEAVMRPIKRDAWKGSK